MKNTRERIAKRIWEVNLRRVHLSMPVKSWKKTAPEAKEFYYELADAAIEEFEKGENKKCKKN